MKRSNTIFAFALFAIAALPGCGPSSSNQDGVTLNAGESAATRAALDKQGDMLAAAAGRATDASTTPKRPTYKMADFDWDDTPEAKPFKRQVVKGVNRLLRENARCADIQPLSLSRSVNGFSKMNPVFFIICDTADGQSFGTKFNANEVDDPAVSLAATGPIDEPAAAEACKRAARGDIAVPRSGPFSYMLDNNFRTFPDGRAVLGNTFFAGNASDDERQFHIFCYFKGRALTSHEVRTQ